MEFMFNFGEEKPISEEVLKRVFDLYQKSENGIVITEQLITAGEMNEVIQARKELFGDGIDIINGTHGYSIYCLCILKDGIMKPVTDEDDIEFFDGGGRRLTASQANVVAQKNQPIKIRGADSANLASQIMVYNLVDSFDTPLFKEIASEKETKD